MHDGAVVISGDRVIAAQCFLPLSRRKDLPKNFGTRHLAAIGLTEITDAKVIVVSEERGLVSLVTGGALYSFPQISITSDACWSLRKKNNESFYIFIPGQVSAIFHLGATDERRPLQYPSQKISLGLATEAVLYHCRNIDLELGSECRADQSHSPDPTSG